jgi:hypothetical protein
VLFGLLMRGSTANQSVILAALPGASSGVKVGRLVDQAREFVAFYAEVSGGLQEVREGGVGGVDVGERGGGKSEDVVRDVIVFLEGLRDGKV